MTATTSCRRRPSSSADGAGHLKCCTDTGAASTRRGHRRRSASPAPEGLGRTLRHRGRDHHRSLGERRIAAHDPPASPAPSSRASGGRARRDTGGDRPGERAPPSALAAMEAAQPTISTTSRRLSRTSLFVIDDEHERLMLGVWVIAGRHLFFSAGLDLEVSCRPRPRTIARTACRHVRRRCAPRCRGPSPAPPTVRCGLSPRAKGLKRSGRNAGSIGWPVVVHRHADRVRPRSTGATSDGSGVVAVRDGVSEEVRHDLLEAVGVDRAPRSRPATRSSMVQCGIAPRAPRRRSW